MHSDGGVGSAHHEGRKSVREQGGAPSVCDGEEAAVLLCRHTLMWKPIGYVGSAAGDAALQTAKLFWAEFGFGTLVRWWLEDMKTLAPERARLITRVL
jgi:hypothetical protein